MPSLRSGSTYSKNASRMAKRRSSSEVVAVVEQHGVERLDAGVGEAVGLAARRRADRLDQPAPLEPAERRVERPERHPQPSQLGELALEVVAVAGATAEDAEDGEIEHGGRL